jgi:hypothetical protein
MEDPAERRERLKRLREEAQAQTNDQARGKEAAAAFSDLHFRNYKPRNELIGARKVCYLNILGGHQERGLLRST